MTEEQWRRSIDSLVQIGGRMRYLAHGTTSNPSLITPQKLAGELEGMAAWVIAFARSLGGYREQSIEDARPSAPCLLELIALRFEREPLEQDGGESDAAEIASWTCHAQWPSQDLTGTSRGASSPELAAFAGLITLVALRATAGGLAPPVAVEFERILRHLQSSRVALEGEGPLEAPRLGNDARHD